MEKPRNKRIPLAYLRGELQRVQNYDDPDEALDVLLSGFGAYLKRHGLGTQQSITSARKKGYLSRYLAELFCKYCGCGMKL